MNEESTFRAVLIVGFVTIFMITIYHRLRSWESKEPLDRRQEGVFILVTPVVLLIGVLLLTWTLRSLGVNLTDTVVTRQEHTLITHGPYRWVRHPFYDALALFVVAFALIAANWFILVAGAIVFLLLAIRSQTEEALLLARFGESYRAYRESTGRFLPRWRGGRGD